MGNAGTPDDFRAQAERLRAQAASMTLPHIRDELLRIADAFERLAERRPYPAC